MTKLSKVNDPAKTESEIKKAKMIEKIKKMEKEKKKKEFENSTDPAVRFLRESMHSSKMNPKLNPYHLAK